MRTPATEIEDVEIGVVRQLLPIGACARPVVRVARSAKHFLAPAVENQQLATGVFQDAGDAVDVGSGNLGNVVCPVLPVVSVAHLLHNLGAR